MGSWHRSIWPRFEDLDEAQQRLLHTIRAQIRLHGTWPTVRQIAHDVGIGVQEVHDVIAGVGGDLVGLRDGRAGLTVKGTLIFPDAASEAALLERWVRLIAERSLVSSSPTWRVSELSGQDSPERQAVQLALVHSEQRGTLDLGFAVGSDSYPQDLSELLRDHVPWVPNPMHMTGPIAAAHVFNLANAVAAGTFDRRRFAWLFQSLANITEAAAAREVSRWFAWSTTGAGVVASLGGLQLRALAARLTCEGSNPQRLPPPATEADHNGPPASETSQLVTADLRIVVLPDRLNITTGAHQYIVRAAETGHVGRRGTTKAWRLLQWVAVYRFLPMPPVTGQRGKRDRGAIQALTSNINTSLMAKLNLSAEVLICDGKPGTPASRYWASCELSPSTELDAAALRQEFADWFLPLQERG